jgi:hypothetical protein
MPTPIVSVRRAREAELIARISGAGTVLFEVRGQSDDWGQKKNGR